MCPSCQGLGHCARCEGRKEVESWDGWDDAGHSGQGGTWCPACFDAAQGQSHGRCRQCDGIGEILG